MKKNTIIAAIAAASALFLCASCQKQELPTPANNGVKVFTATIEQDVTKTTINSSYKVYWAEGDKVSINHVEYTATSSASNPTKATLTADGQGADLINEKYAAIYPATLYVTDHFEFPATQTYAADQFNAPMYAESDTVSFEFKNICGVLCLSLKGTDKVRSISVTANEPICGTFTMTDASTINLTGEGKTVTLDCGTEGVQLGEGTAKNFYIYLPPKESYTAGMKIAVTNTEGKVFENTTTKDVRIEKNNLYTFDWEVSYPLSGVFSVSATKKVHFSKGNLWADYFSNALYFESNQYSFESYWNVYHMSHFTWSSTVEAAVGDSNSGDYLFCDEDHKVSVGGSEAIYYALSKDEWTYLFNNHSIKWVSVNGINGYVIAPDGFSGTLADTYANDAALAAAGNLVFLPAAGSREGSTVNDVGDNGNYWSSSANGESYAYNVFFNSSLVNPGRSRRYSGFSVRLVTNVK